MVDIKERAISPTILVQPSVEEFSITQETLHPFLLAANLPVLSDPKVMPMINQTKESSTSSSEEENSATKSYINDSESPNKSLFEYVSEYRRHFASVFGLNAQKMNEIEFCLQSITTRPHEDLKVIRRHLEAQYQLIQTNSFYPFRPRNFPIWNSEGLIHFKEHSKKRMNGFILLLNSGSFSHGSSLFQNNRN